MRTMSGGQCSHYDCANRNSFGYCKTTACINPKYSNIGTAQYGQGVQKRIATNADRIRSMTDDELAEFAVSTGQGCAPGKNFVECCFEHKDGLVEADCRKCWLDWLKQEDER